MSCSFYQYLSPFLDGELDSLKAKGIEEHLETCESCRRELNLVLQIRNSLRQGAASMKAPPGLKEKIMDETRQTRPRVFIPRLSFAHATGLVAVLLFASILTFYYWSLDRDSFSDVVDTLVRYHAAYGTGTRSLTIKSSDSQNAASWLEEKLGFKTPIPHAAFAGFSLKGADIFEQGDRKVAYLKYLRKGKVIGYFIFKDFAFSIDPLETVDMGDIKLYVGKKKETNFAVWKKRGLVYLILTNENRSELLEYAERCIVLF
jgi:anti-sigma factor (TIGR02949 family)